MYNGEHQWKLSEASTTAQIKRAGDWVKKKFEKIWSHARHFTQNCAKRSQMKLSEIVQSALKFNNDS